MAITPPSDIVLGVALAADPDKYRAAAERLQRMSAAAADVDVSEWRAIVASQAAREGGVAVAASPAAALSPGGTTRRGRTSPDAFGQLEAFVLQTFIQSMLPKNAVHVFGKGTAGEVWKSMLAEKLAGEIARSGQVGLAKRLQSAAVPGGVPRTVAIPPSHSLASVLPYLRNAPAIEPTPEGEKS